jgi:hypothetical protein
MRWLAACALALSACNPQQPQAAASPAAPAPRYQAVPTEAGIYVIDTTSGNVSKCMTAITEETWCTTPVSVSEGKGPPAWIKGSPRQP